MPKKNSLLKAPYRRIYRYEGNDRVDRGWELMEYPETWSDNPIEWRSNDPFEATLELQSMERGRSAARFVWKDDKTNTYYPMFMSGMLDLAQNSNIFGGLTQGKWIVVKRGSNYGIERYED